MKPVELWRAAKQWVPFAARTAFYGTLSVTLGPITPGHSASLWAMRRWCQTSTRGLSIRVEAEGLDNVPEGAFVYCSNHQSIVDIIVLGSVLTGDYKWAAKRSLLKIPFLGWHLKLAGHVPVDRGGGARAVVDVVQRFAAVLKAGKPLLIFPEGTRTETGGLKPFKNGGFYAAVRAGVPVVPVALQGTFDLMKRGAQHTGEDNFRVVRVAVGAPIYPSTSIKEGARVADLRQRCFASLSALLLGIGDRVETAAETATRETAEAARREARGTTGAREPAPLNDHAGE